MTEPGLLARVDVLIVNYNAGPWLKRCLNSLELDQNSELSILVVDNDSSDNSLDGIGDSGPIRIDRTEHNLGFAGAVQRGLQQIQREFVLVLNPDCMISPDDLSQLVQELDQHPDSGLVSGRVVGEDGLEQRASRRLLPTPKRIVHELLPGQTNEGIDLTHTTAPDQTIETEAVSGACMLMRRKALDAIGGFDTNYPLHFEDLDLFARLQSNGWTLRWCPEVRITHIGGQSSSSRPIGVLWAKHRGLWRYMNQHCKAEWPVWQRPLWALALVIHGAIKTPLIWLSSRRK